VLPISSIGVAPQNCWRSRITDSMERERLLTTRSVSSLYCLIYAKTRWSEASRNSIVPRPKARCCLRTVMSRRNQCSTEVSRRCYRQTFARAVRRRWHPCTTGYPSSLFFPLPFFQLPAKMAHFRECPPAPRDRVNFLRSLPEESRVAPFCDTKRSGLT
jgi:hypothetical protein